MKKIISVMCIVVMLTLTACGSAGFAGKWKLTDIKNIAQIHMDPSVTGNSIEFELNDDGKGTMTWNDASTDVTWTESDNGVDILPANGTPWNMTEEEGKLIIVDQNSNTFYFEKQ